ncbi:Si-specific NAD(P)(+) transhydrogenase [Mucisphaera calidilacus]|uniref:Soluble pyridine nucleotide transhydrogenase n=1 Tax=Mucisphaera calidilacus TaxID=2527982 RepID=A0A518BXY5_9BACT|nr:Si-specific NAD(P)(+) transhydrogenase [Mucisphaera calidilacus]QDU71814.1 Soluble pyridine nucleotide transhydrogenase [Mucisphaera calidilacus]
MRHYDAVVIGTGPAGQKAAIQAAKLGKSVAIIEKGSVLGGAQVNTGTVPSKALREAAMHLTGAGKRGLFGESYRVKKTITIRDLVSVSQQVIRNEWEVIREQLDRNGVDLLWGKAHFEGPNLVQIVGPDHAEMVTGDVFVLCVGTRPATPDHVPFNDNNILTSDSFLQVDRLPRSLIVVGGGVIGTEYACIMATLGVKVTLVEGRPKLLGFIDSEISEALQFYMRREGVTLRLGEKVDRIYEIPEEERQNTNGSGGPQVVAQLESGKTLKAECLLYAIGRQGVCGDLGLDNVGVAYDDRERLSVNERYQTSVPHVYAAGDVIGFPSLASTSMEQGRRAMCHALGTEIENWNTELFPYGIYGVPEISMVGKTEEQLTDEGIPYEAGIASYKEIARGQLLGDEFGMLKVLIHQENHTILGVHAIGSGATEIIHIGQAVMAHGGKAEYFINNVFNFPTLAEAYKVAAYNGLNKLAHV